MILVTGRGQNRHKTHRKMTACLYYHSHWEQSRDLKVRGERFRIMNEPMKLFFYGKKLSLKV